MIMRSWLDQYVVENKTIPEVVLERGLLTQEQLNDIFKFENLVSEIVVVHDEECV